MRILLTGASGTVGSHLSKMFSEAPEVESLFIFTGDITNMADVREIFNKTGRIDALVNLAAIVPVESVKANPEKAYAVNVGGAINLATVLIEQKNTKYFFQCSTSHVYAPATVPLSELASTVPHSVYGRTKYLAELALTDIACAHGLTLCCGRLFSIHDPSQKGSFLRPRIESRLRTENLKEPIAVHGANSLRDFLTAKEAAKIIQKLVLANFEGIINIASGQTTSVRDFVQSLSPVKLDIVHVGKQDCLSADTSKLRTFLKKFESKK
jgi:nucleoside-diphosphate-sugar epimerase